MDTKKFSRRAHTLPPDLYSSLLQKIPSSSCTQRWKRDALARALRGRLDRVKVLGSDATGHTGCVNALSWAQDGELLISSGDDTNVRIWRMDPMDDTTDYPYKCQSVIQTGHTQNVFNAQMLPYSSRIATVAGDSQVRVFDASEAVGRSALELRSEITYSTRRSLITTLCCHSDRTKRIVAEESPDLFLTVAVDGQVRQHDLRMSHDCKRGTCPAPIVQLPHDLSTIALSPLTPYEFVVAGEHPLAHVFDRRNAGRFLWHEWGMAPDEEKLTTCVRRLGRPHRAPGERRGHEHVTGARMSTHNGHEVLLSYSSDAVYLFSTRDEPQAKEAHEEAILPPNAKRTKLEPWDISHSPPSSGSPSPHNVAISSAMRDTIRLSPLMDMDGYDEGEGEGEDDGESDGDEDEDEEDEEDEKAVRSNADIHADVPVILPRSRFVGHANVATTKDVNFLGPYDEYVVSGSDDGNFFIWDKSSKKLVDILEGDGSIVNVIEGHPHRPLVAVSGIDHTVKLFAPAHRPSRFSKIGNMANITAHNARLSREGIAPELSFLRMLLTNDSGLRLLTGDEEEIPCRHQ